MVEAVGLPNMEVPMTGGEGERERRGDRCTISWVGGWREGGGIVHLSTTKVTVYILSLDMMNVTNSQTKLGRHA